MSGQGDPDLTILRLTEIDKDCRVSARIFPAGLEKVLVNEFLIGNGNP